MDCDLLRGEQWKRIKDIVPGGTKGKRRPRTDNRDFSMPFSGWRVPVGVGATCLDVWVITAR